MKSALDWFAMFKLVDDVVDQEIGAAITALRRWDDEPIPRVQRELVAQRHRFDDHQRAIALPRQLAGKLTQRVTRWRDERALSVRVHGDLANELKAAPSGSDLADALTYGVAWLTGERGGERPAAVRGWLKAHHVADCSPLPICEAQLATSERDLEAQLVRLQAALDAWEREKSTTTA